LTAGTNQLLAYDRYAGRGFDPDPDAPAGDAQHDAPNRTTNLDPLTGFPRED
jgi:hypothetical protein